MGNQNFYKALTLDTWSIANRSKQIVIAERKSPEVTIDIGALKAGDEGAFGALVETYQDRVFNTCLGFLESKEEAEDAAQETFIEVCHAVQNFREEAKLSTWIYRIAVSKSLMAIRKKRRKKRFAIFYSSEKEGDELEQIGDADERNHPLAQLENKEEDKPKRRHGNIPL